jgi:DNA invertase Pin-like site-specific DNA recombinase
MTGEDDPYQKAMLQLLGVFAELEAEMTRERVKEGIRTGMNNEEYHHGPAPLGFEKEDGYLIEASNFDRVRSVLELVQDDELSKRKAARQLDTSRRTINRALERTELYSI